MRPDEGRGGHAGRARRLFGDASLWQGVPLSWNAAPGTGSGGAAPVDAAQFRASNAPSPAPRAAPLRHTASPIALSLHITSSLVLFYIAYVLLAFPLKHTPANGFVILDELMPIQYWCWGFIGAGVFGLIGVMAPNVWLRSSTQFVLSFVHLLIAWSFARTVQATPADAVYGFVAFNMFFLSAINIYWFTIWNSALAVSNGRK